MILRSPPTKAILCNLCEIVAVELHRHLIPPLCFQCFISLQAFQRGTDFPEKKWDLPLCYCSVGTPLFILVCACLRLSIFNSLCWSWDLCSPHSFFFFCQPGPHVIVDFTYFCLVPDHADYKTPFPMSVETFAASWYILKEAFPYWGQAQLCKKGNLH